MTSLNYLEERAANLSLMIKIQRFWQKEGHSVSTWTEKVASPDGGSIYVVRSSIRQNVNTAENGYSIG